VRLFFSPEQRAGLLPDAQGAVNYAQAAAGEVWRVPRHAIDHDLRLLFVLLGQLFLGQQL
jgi:hypothetical protein